MQLYTNSLFRVCVLIFSVERLFKIMVSRLDVSLENMHFCSGPV